MMAVHERVKSETAIKLSFRLYHCYNNKNHQNVEKRKVQSSYLSGPSSEQVLPLTSFNIQICEGHIRYTELEPEIKQIPIKIVG